jgi:hypothetical protein
MSELFGYPGFAEANGVIEPMVMIGVMTRARFVPGCKE